MRELGIWSEWAGGFIETGLYSESDAVEAIEEWVDKGESRDDLGWLTVCPEHEEQPADACESCDMEMGDE